MLDMAIVGSGPAGISMAVEAVRAGIPRDRIVVFEKGDAHAWSIRKFYRENKPVTANYKGREAVCHGVLCIADTTKDGVMSYLDDAIQRHGIDVRYNTPVHGIRRRDDGAFEVHAGETIVDTRVCVVAIGILERPNKPNYAIPGPLGGRVHFDVTSETFANEEILVVGGGDSASEYTQYLSEIGNRVTLAHRGAEFTRMNEINRTSLLALGEQGRATVLRSADIVRLEDDGGRPRAVFSGEAIAPKTFDHIVYALGGTTPENFLRAIGIEFSGGEANLRDGYETNIPGLFLIGDLSLGRKGGSIVSAFNTSHEAMRRICTDHLACRESTQ